MRERVDERMPTDEDIAFYKERGYWISPKIIDDERLEKLKHHMDQVYAGQFETGKAPWTYWQGEPGMRQTNNSYWADYTLSALAQDPVIGQIAAQLMGTNTVRIWHDQLLYKPGGANSSAMANVGWHQDYAYWQCAAEPTLITAWIAFDDVNLDNGCMQVIPGSHQSGLFNVNNFFEQDLEKQRRELNLPDDVPFAPVPLIMKAGQVSFHHALALHGSGANSTDNPRRSLTVHLMAGETKYKAGTSSDDHMNVGLMKPKDGDVFAGEWFPVTYEE
ncbi:phytanoyl-CoA dioxygenase family protein [Cohnella soli]|uniref:Phytanoyl-CoA dioxygenase family protein n=1 Tax=Cohnella soli TaxID=425005 RepID=A0ABW0I232_9BACL